MVAQGSPTPLHSFPGFGRNGICEWSVGLKMAVWVSVFFSFARFLVFGWVPEAPPPDPTVAQALVGMEFANGQLGSKVAVSVSHFFSFARFLVCWCRQRCKFGLGSTEAVCQRVLFAFAHFPVCGCRQRSKSLVGVQGGCVALFFFAFARFPVPGSLNSF